MAVVKKKYGLVPPTARILVRIQEVEGKTTKSTRSYAIYGRDLDDVTQIVEEALDNHFGEENEYTGEQDEPAPVVKKKKKR